MKTISYRLQFIDGARFMASPLSNLVDNLAEGIHKIQWTNCNMNFLKYTNAKDDLIECKCLQLPKTFDENLKKRFANTKLASMISISFLL